MGIYKQYLSFVRINSLVKTFASKILKFLFWVFLQTDYL